MVCYKDVYPFDQWRCDDDRDGTAPMQSSRSSHDCQHCRGGALCHDPNTNYSRDLLRRWRECSPIEWDLFLEPRPQYIATVYCSNCDRMRHIVLVQIN